MPFVEPGEEPLGGIQEMRSPPEVPPKRDPEFFTELLPAAFRQESMFGGGRTPLTGTVNKNFNPFVGGKIAGYEHWARAFALAQSDEDVAIIKRNIEQELEDQRTIAAAGFLGTMTSITMGFIDPLTLIPFGGFAYRGVRAGRTIRNAGISAARAEARRSLVRESYLQAKQDTRTADHSVNSIAMATALSAVLGSGGKAIALRIAKKSKPPVSSTPRSGPAGDYPGSPPVSKSTGSKELSTIDREFNAMMNRLVGELGPSASKVRDPLMPGQIVSRRTP